MGYFISENLRLLELSIEEAVCLFEIYNAPDRIAKYEVFTELGELCSQLAGGADPNWLLSVSVKDIRRLKKRGLIYHKRKLGDHLLALKKEMVEEIETFFNVNKLWVGRKEFKEIYDEDVCAFMFQTIKIGFCFAS